MGEARAGVVVEVCRHTGARMCARCSWTRPHEAVLLVLRGRTARTALPVAAAVGTVLSLVNQGSTILDGAATTSTWIRVAVNYVVPFIVASVGYLAGRRARPDAPSWRQYLADYHDDRPGITELLMGSATDRRRERPYPWLMEPLRGQTEVILDLACGSAPTRDLVRDRRWLGVDL